MVDSFYSECYIKCCWTIFSTDSIAFDKFNSKYGSYLCRLIHALKISKTTLVISLYYLYKYNSNSISKIDLSEDYSVLNSVIVTSLILANKTFNDQSYTLKTWYTISKDQLGFEQISLELLNQFESHFLSVTNYNLNYIGLASDSSFWSIFFENYHALCIPIKAVQVFRSCVVKSDTPATPATTPRKILPITKNPSAQLQASKPYPSPMKTISIPNTPISARPLQLAPSSQIVFATPSMMIPTPVISTSNSPYYSQHYIYNYNAPANITMPTKRRKIFPAPLLPVMNSCDVFYAASN